MNLHCCSGSLFFPFKFPLFSSHIFPMTIAVKLIPEMKPNLLLSFLLLLFLQVMWSVATDIISHGAGDQARRLPQLLEDLPLHGRNVTVKLSGGDDSGEESVEVDGGERLSHSKKSTGGKGGKGVGGAGSQSLRQPRPRKSSSSTSMRRPYCFLSGIGLLPSLLLLCVALT